MCTRVRGRRTNRGDNVAHQPDADRDARDPLSVELALAIVGVVGTLSAAVVTQVLATRAEARRHQREDETRWLSDHRRISAQLVAGALTVERQLWSACSHLDREARAERLPGHTSILLTPPTGVPPVLDGLTREIVVDAVEDAFEALEELELLAAEVALTGTSSETDRARELLESLHDVVGLLETFASFDDAADAVERSRSARDAYVDAARIALRAPGLASSPDSRPRRPPH